MESPINVLEAEWQTSPSTHVPWTGTHWPSPRILQGEKRKSLLGQAEQKKQILIGTKPLTHQTTYLKSPKWYMKVLRSKPPHYLTAPKNPVLCCFSFRFIDFTPILALFHIWQPQWIAYVARFLYYCRFIMCINAFSYLLSSVPQVPFNLLSGIHIDLKLEESFEACLCDGLQERPDSEYL